MGEVAARRRTFLGDVDRVDILFQIERILALDLLLAGDVAAGILLRKHERVVFSGGRNDVEPVLGVELAKHFDREVERRGDLSQMHEFRDADRVDGQRQGRFGQFDAVLLVVGVGVGGADEGRDIAARFTRQVVVDLPEGLAAARTGDSLVDVPRPAVVGGDRQHPVAEDGVHVFEVAAGGAGRQHGIVAFVDERVDFQSVEFSRRRHELPQACGAHARHGRRVERRFDDRQRPQFDGEPRLDQLLLDQREIVLRQPQDAADRTVAGIGVAGDVTADDGVVGELDGRYELLQPACVDRVGRRVVGAVCGGVFRDVAVEEVVVGGDDVAPVPPRQERVAHFGRIVGAAAFAEFRPLRNLGRIDGLDVFDDVDRIGCDRFGRILFRPLAGTLACGGGVEAEDRQKGEQESVSQGGFHRRTGIIRS